MNRADEMRNNVRMYHSEVGIHRMANEKYKEILSKIEELSLRGEDMIRYPVYENYNRDKEINKILYGLIRNDGFDLRIGDLQFQILELKSRHLFISWKDGVSIDPTFR
ncbi:hypothetical protein [Enterococcus sp. N249-2]